VRTSADPPRIQQHAGEIAYVVSVEVGDEHRVQAPEIEARVDERRRCSATAVDDKDAVADDER
jgi:hypothetical protein